MNFISISGKTAIFYFSDSVENKHTEMIDEIKKVMDSGFNVFVFDFFGVKSGFTSYMVGFVVALASIINDTHSTIKLQNIVDHDVELLKTAGLESLSNILIQE